MACVLISVFMKTVYLELSQEPFRHSQGRPYRLEHWIALWDMGTSMAQGGLMPT